MEEPPDMTSRSPLTRPVIVDAALGLADTSGIGAVTMRGVAAELGVEGMALYRYVRNKDDLLDAIAERLLADLDLRRARRRGLSWRSVIRAVVAAWVDLADRHRETFVLLYRDRTPTSQDLEPAQLIIGALRAAGFTAVAAARAYRIVTSFVDGVLLSRSIRGYAPETDQWHQLIEDLPVAPGLDEAAPILAAIDTRAVIEYGVEALLRGLAAR